MQSALGDVFPPLLSQRGRISRGNVRPPVRSETYPFQCEIRASPPGGRSGRVSARARLFGIVRPIWGALCLVTVQIIHRSHHSKAGRASNSKSTHAIRSNAIRSAIRRDVLRKVRVNIS